MNGGTSPFPPQQIDTLCTRPPIFACSASYGTAGHPVSRALDIAGRADVLDLGGVVYHAAAHELLAVNDIKERYCSV